MTFISLDYSMIKLNIMMKSNNLLNNVRNSIIIESNLDS